MLYKIQSTIYFNIWLLEDKFTCIINKNSILTDYGKWFQKIYIIEVKKSFSINRILVSIIWVAEH